MTTADTAPANTANATQVGGAHYKVSIEHWDFVVARKLGYFEGQITKYVTRWRKKGGAQDLRKAQHFLTKLAELRAAGKVPPLEAPQVAEPGASIMEYAKANDLNGDETDIISCLLYNELDAAASFLAELIAKVERDNGAPGT